MRPLAERVAPTPAKYHVFKAHCPNCARETVFVAYKAEKSVTPIGATEAEHVARLGFRCNECHRVQPEMKDSQGAMHRWEDLVHVVGEA